MTFTPARIILLPVLLLVVVGCGSDSDIATSSPATSSAGPTADWTATATDAPSAGTSSPVAPQAGPATDRAFDVAYTDGQVTGDSGRLEVALGESVTLSVTSSVADEIHLHGYDVSAPVAPGAPAVLTFEATIPGVFELELEQLGAQLASLQVQ